MPVRYWGLGELLLYGGNYCIDGISTKIRKAIPVIDKRIEMGSVEVI